MMANSASWASSSSGPNIAAGGSETGSGTGAGTGFWRACGRAPASAWTASSRCRTIMRRAVSSSPIATFAFAPIYRRARQNRPMPMLASCRWPRCRSIELLDYDRTLFSRRPADVPQPLDFATGCARARLSAPREARRLRNRARCLEGCKIGPLFADGALVAEALYTPLAAFCRRRPFVSRCPGKQCRRHGARSAARDGRRVRLRANVSGASPRSRAEPCLRRHELRTGLMPGPNLANAYFSPGASTTAASVVSSRKVKVSCKYSSTVVLEWLK